ncbi:MAG: hypothetical protein JXL20_10355 [Deltaproteobacteria bacterium]|nr:hypothetical protein [Deltaproteobacteria bacterium]
MKAIKRDPSLTRSYRHEWLHNEQIFPPLLRYNMAHVLMLADKGVIPTGASRRLLRALQSLARSGFASMHYEPALDGLQPNIEAALTRRLGPDDAGWLNTGRARQECEFVARQIAVRDGLLDVAERTVVLRAALEALAQRTVHDTMPYYTWAQQAEPVTLGYYLTAAAEAFAEDGNRLRAAYRSINRSRASCGQVAPPPLPIDRGRVGRWLGFQGSMANSLYAYSSLDAELEVLSALSLLGANLARFAENVYVWCSAEFGFMAFGDAFSGTSYAMPQKKNPYALRQVRPVAARIAAAWSEVMALFSGGLPMVGNGIIHAPNRLLECFDQMNDVLTLLARALPTLEVNTTRMLAACADHWVQAPQLVFYLVRSHAIAFRQAHHVVRAVIDEAVRRGLKPTDVDARMVEAAVLAVTLRRLQVAKKELALALEPDLGVATRTAGGPAPRSVQRQLRLLDARLKRDSAWCTAEARRLQRAEADLQAAVHNSLKR